jgi:hypothetical protein
MVFLLRIVNDIKVYRAIWFVSKSIIDDLLNESNNFGNVFTNSSNNSWQPNIQLFHILKKLSLLFSAKISKINFILVGSHYNFVIDISDIHAEFDIVAKVISHNSS